jgi:hypothetical protein
LRVFVVVVGAEIGRNVGLWRLGFYAAARVV